MILSHMLSLVEQGEVNLFRAHPPRDAGHSKGT